MTALRAASTGAASRPVPRRVDRQPLRLVTRRPAGAPRTPFVLLVLALLGAGLVALLLLNAAAVANAGDQRRLRQKTAELEAIEQQLRRSVTSMQAPEALASAARKLGMVPGGDPAYLVVLPDGSSRVIGTPQPAPSPSSTGSGASPTGSGAGEQG